jgi:hypothetical protein
MTDKQIIIDEIDISKCEFCNDGEYCYIYSGTADFKWMCKENEDCQIKNLLLQLKLTEQRIVELNKTIQAKEQSLEKIKLMLQTIIETNKIYPLQNNLLKLLDIIEGKDNG